MSANRFSFEPALVARARTAATIVLLRASAIAAKFGIALFIAHFLDLQALGLYGLVAGAAVVVPVVLGLSIISVLARASVHQDLHEVTGALVPYWALVTLLYVAVMLLCLPVAVPRGVAGLSVLIGLLLLVEHLNADVLIILNFRSQPRFANLLFTVRSAAWIGVYIGLALFIPALRTITAVLVFWLAGAAVALGAFFVACRDWPWRPVGSPRAAWTTLRALVRNARTLYLNDLANTGGQYLDRYIVGAFLGLQSAGVYFLFWSLSNALSNVVNTSLLQVQQPAIIRAHDEPARQGRLLGHLRVEALLVSVGLAVSAALLAALAIAVLPPSPFSRQGAVLAVLLAGFVLRVGYEVEGVGLYGRHEDGTTLASAALTLCVSLATTAALTPTLGLLGPALAVVASYAVGGLWRRRRNLSALAPKAPQTGDGPMPDDAPSGRTDVALFMPTLIGGGAERVQLALAKHFLQQGLRVDVVVCKGIGDLREHLPDGARLVDLGGRRVLLGLRHYERYLRAARPRSVISSVENASVIACLARARNTQPHRLIVRQDNALVAAAALWREPRRWFWLLALALAYRFADQLVAVSRGVEGQLRQLVGRSGPPVRCVYNSVLAPDFDVLVQAKPDLPAIPSGVPLLVAAGRLHPVKDYPVLLRAFARLRRTTKAHLLILGVGPARPELEALCAALAIADAVTFAGFVANPLPVIRRADVFVLSSRSEGLGGVLVEALAAGTPVVSTDCRHGPREVLADGRFGRLVPVGDVEALAAAMREALAAPRPAETVALRNHLAQFTTEHAGRAYVAMLTGPHPSPERGRVSGAAELGRP